MEPQPIKLNHDDELARRLREDAATPVYVEADGMRFRVVREVPAVNLTDDPATPYDHARVRAALRASAGAFRGIDTDTLKRDIREARAQDTAGRPA